MGGGSRRSRRRDWWTSDRRRQPDRIHARPAVGMKLQMNHRERTNPRGPDRGTDRPTMPEGIRRVGRPAWQDGLGSDGEQHGTYMSIEQVMCILPEIVVVVRDGASVSNSASWLPPEDQFRKNNRSMAPRRLGGEQGGAFLLRSAKGGNFLLQSYVSLRVARRDRSRVGTASSRFHARSPAPLAPTTPSYVRRSGIPSKVVQDAVSEVADDFNAYSRKRKSKNSLDQPMARASVGSQRPDSDQGVSLERRQQEDDSSAYNVSLGQRFVLQSKFLVTFRMVDTIMVFYVAEPDSNPLISLRYVDAAAKILVGLSKGVDISHKRLAKKYADLYVLFGKLLARGVRHLPGAFVHAPATNEKLLTMPVSTFEGKRKLKKVLENRKTKNAFVRTTSQGSEAEVGEAGRDAGVVSPSGAPRLSGMAEMHESLMRRVWDQSGHDVRTVEFEVPAGALPPPPRRVLGAKRTPPAPPLLSEALMERAWSGALRGSSSEDGDGDGEERGREEPGDGDRDGDGDGDAPGEDETSVNGRPNVAGGTDGAEVHRRRLRRRDLRQAVVMVEVWKGVVKSNKLVSVDAHGAIRRALAPFNVDSVLFRMHPSKSLDIDAAFQVASVHNKFVRVVEDGSRKNVSSTFSAALSGIPIDATYLKYALPSAAVRPPLQASIVIGGPSSSSSPSASSDAASRQLLVCIPYAVDPELAPAIPSLVDVSFTLSFPPDVVALVKTSHPAEWCPIQSKVQWALGALEAGTHGVVRAIVSFKNADRRQLNETIERVSKDIKATILFSGYPGRSYSGLAFDLGDLGDLGEAGTHVPPDQGAEGVDSTEALGDPSCDQFFAGHVRTFGELQLSV